MVLILDTNAVSALLDGDTAVAATAAGANQVFIPVVVLGEYRFGVLQSSRREVYDLVLSDLIRRSKILSVEEETASQYAAIRLELRTAGTPIPVNDLWIAALARQHRLPILSRDRHFDRVAGLRRIGW